jgi:hypothetical protein
MDYIDFSKKKSTILYQILHSSDLIPIDNSKALYDYYKYIHFFRHNLLHYLVLESLGQAWTEEKQLQDLVDIKMPKEYALKTPDIYLRKDKVVLLIDVSISFDIHKSKIQKEEKYGNIAKWLTENNNINTIFIHINVQSSYANLLQEIEKIKNYQQSEFDNNTFFRAMSIIEDKKKWVNDNIDKEIFETLKNIENEKQDNQNKDANNDFKNHLKYENIGMYSDLDIDYDLFKDFNKKYTNVEEIVESNKNFDELKLVEYLKNILNDKEHEINKKYKDENLTDSQFDDAYSKIKIRNKEFKIRKPKPTHHLLIPFADDIIPQDIEMREQKGLMEFMTEFEKEYINIDINSKKEKMMFLRDLFQEIMGSLTKSVDGEHNEKIFNNNDEELINLKKKYQDVKYKLNLQALYQKKKKINSRFLEKVNSKIDKKDKEAVERYMSEINEELKIYSNDSYDDFKSFRSFLRIKEMVKETDEVTYAKENKIFKVSFSSFSEPAKIYYDKTGINKPLNEMKKIPEQAKETIELENSVRVDEFLEYMKCKNKYEYNYKEANFLTNTENIGCDSSESISMKKESIKNYTLYYDILKKTNAYNYSRNLHNCYQQLMHAVQINTGQKTFYIFNSGIRNLIVIVAMSYHSNRKDEGKSFMSVIKTTNPNLYTNFFGKTYKAQIGNTGVYYVATNWRKLKLSKITFMRDTFYSTLSSTMNTIMSSAVVVQYLSKEKIEYIYSLRILIGYATNQRIGELLVDTRYAYMSALSVYTNINKLIQEKFGPCYTTSLECWIIERLMNRLPKIHNSALTEGIMQSKIEMSHNVRNINTIGGLIKLPSLWGNYFMTDITELLDEAFVYVHTMKEPSNIYHENVKAVKTIHAFQTEYDSLPYKIKKGLLSNEKDWDFFLKYNTKIGCSGPIIMNSTKYNLEKEKPFFKKNNTSSK